MRAPSLVALVLGALLMLVPSSASAQAVTGTLLGNVTDSSGAAIPGATVTATDVDKNTTRSTVTNESGYYIFNSLASGNYTVDAEIQGFKKTARQGVKVDVNTTVRVDLSLSVGQMTEEVTVAAESPALQTDRTDTGRILESKMVSELPLTFNRNFQSLSMTVPGITRPHREHSQFFNSQDSLRYEVNGQPGMASNTLIEGLDDNQKTGLLQVIIPAADALETVSISTSNYDAEFGRSGGAVTNVTIKSGTNDLKGSAFFFGNNEKTNAGDYFSHQKAPTKFVNGGFTLGGPIVKSKLFFFGDYQRTLDNLGSVYRATVPTLAMRNGDFSASASKIYDPYTPGADVSGANRVAFPGNMIPQDRISPIAKKLLAFIPEPNIVAPLGQNNWQKAQVREKTTDGFDTKVNYTISAKDQMSYRVSFMRPVVFDPGAFEQYGGPANGGFAGTGTNTSSSTAVTWTRVFGPKTVLDVRGGLNYYHNVTATQGNGLTTSSDVGIPGANLDEYTSGISYFNIAGYTDPLLGFSASQPWDRSEKTWSVVSTLTKMMSTHTVKIGGEWRHNRDMLLQTQDAGGPRGRFNFTSSGTTTPADQSTSSSVANAFAAFLLDWPATVQRDLKVIDQPGTQHMGTFLYMHDKWQAKSNVTVDLGLRWEYYTPLQGLEGKGTLANYDPTTNTIRVAGYGDLNNALNVKNTFTNFNPRTGVSWRLNDKNVVRAGYGASTIPFPDNRYAFNYPVKQNYNGTSANGFQRQGSMAEGFPAPALLDIPADGIIPIAGTSLANATLDVIPTTLREGTLHSWNVAFQRELPYRFTVDVAYVGNRGVNIVMDVDTNAGMKYGAGNAGRPQVATFNRTGTSRTRTNDNKTHYNALQMKIDRRWSNGFLVTNSYTYSKSMDYANENGGINTPIDFSTSWGRSNFDRTHNYVNTVIYELPWGPRKKWLNEGILANIIGGWQISNIFVAQSGVPLSITASTTLFNTPGNTAYANLVGEQKILGGLGPGNLYFDPTAYAQPAAGTQGNMKRNSGPEGPGFWELDSSLFKRFAIGTKRYAEIHVDMYNTTNSVRWDNPNTGFSAATTGNTFGQIQRIAIGSSPRTMRFGFRFVF
jgi:carboxypeptidase family protein